MRRSCHDGGHGHILPRQPGGMAGMDGGTARRVKVWDLAIRLFHWTLVALIGFSWWTATTGRMRWHFLSGFAVLSLVLFRIAWGFLGSDTARFGRFLRAPGAALRHLSTLPRREPDHEAGHNAAGGWMVVLFLALLLAQAGTGLFTDTGYGDRGPLARAVSSATSDRLTGLHHRIVLLILAATALHVAAIAAYRVFKGQNLLRPMLTGTKMLPRQVPAPRLRSPWRAVALLAAAAALVMTLANAG
jgi:cytochrome b